ncbi:fibronectin type III and SPRY domain-containing protein 2 [Gastrophryne carolinensis]
MEEDAEEEFEAEYDTYTILSKADEQLEPIEEETEPEEEGGFGFYHTDLYDSQGRPGIFPNKAKEEPEKQQHEAVQELCSPVPDPEQRQSEMQQEVDELTKLYGFSDEKDSVEDPLLTTPPYAPVQHSIPSIESPQMDEQNTINEDKPETEHSKTDEGQLEEPSDVSEGKNCQAKAHIPQTDKAQELNKTAHDQLPQPEEGKQLHDSELTKGMDSPQKNKTQLPQFEDSNSKADENEDKHDSSTEICDKTEELPDIFCLVCKIPIRAFEKLFGIHKDHNVKEIAASVDDLKDDIHKTMCKLEEQITQIENFAGHLEEIYITVEENFGRQEQNFEMHYTEVMDMIASKHEERQHDLEEKKKLKLESLFEQLVECGKSLDTSKDLMEVIQKLFKQEDKVEFVKTALETTNRLKEYFSTDINLNISTDAEFKKINLDFSDVEKLLDSINTLPVPSAPVINPQAPSSATATSLRVCWSLFSEDTVEHYNLFYKPVSDDAPGEEQQKFMIRSKETYCTVKSLMPNTQYEFWVIAINASGESPASESAVYVTAPAPPIIKTEDCLYCENAAFICWESGNIYPVDSYTVEIHTVKNEAEDNSISESIVGIPICESLIQLKENEKYNISVSAVNVGGPSERSKSISIHTTGTFFFLNKETAHPLLLISDNGFTISCEEEESLDDLPYHCNKFSRCIAVLGNLIPFKGQHFWEVEVEESTEFRVGVAYEDTNRSGVLGANNSSWCLRHVCTPTRHRYEFLHCGVSPDIRITIPPRRIGILLDYDTETVSFYNMDILQHLYTFECQFRHLVHPCFSLEKRGQLKIKNGIPVPHALICC